MPTRLRKRKENLESYLGSLSRQETSTTGRLIERLGARLEGYAFMVELAFLEGRRKLGDSNVFSLITYERES